jgi:hypothetical protein
MHRFTWLMAATAVAGATVAVLPATAMAGTTPGSAQSVPQHCKAGSGGTGVTCSFDVPPGAYDVQLTLGSTSEAANTGIEAEARRTVLAPVSTSRGKTASRTITVDVRTPESMPDGQEGDGTAGLQFTVTGTAPALDAVNVVARPAEPRLYVISDSTAADWLLGPKRGWAQELPQDFHNGLDVSNWAVSGSSTGSWLHNSKLFATLKPKIRTGDEVLIQLAHNDKTTTEKDYRANFQTLINGVTAQGGRPVLVTPPVRHLFDSTGHITPTGRIVNSLGVDLPAVMRDIAKKDHLTLLDLTADSQALLEKLGSAASLKFYADNGTGGTDTTHFNIQGGTTIAGLVVKEITAAKLPAAAFLNS